MSLQYIRDTYGVPAKCGGRVAFTGDGTRQEGTIVSARGQYLRVRMDVDGFVSVLHPTWKLEFLPSSEGVSA